MDMAEFQQFEEEEEDLNIEDFFPKTIPFLFHIFIKCNLHVMQF